MKSKDQDPKWDELINDLKQSDITINKSLTINFQSRKKKENHYRLIEENDYFHSRRKRGKINGGKRK